MLDLVIQVHFRTMWCAHDGDHFGAAHAQFQLGKIAGVLFGLSDHARSVGKGEVQHAADNEAAGLGEGEEEQGGGFADDAHGILFNANGVWWHAESEKALDGRGVAR